MLVPLIVLSIGAIAAGFVFAAILHRCGNGWGFWRGALFFNEHLMTPHNHTVPEPV